MTTLVLSNPRIKKKRLEQKIKELESSKATLESELLTSRDEKQKKEVELEEFKKKSDLDLQDIKEMVESGNYLGLKTKLNIKNNDDGLTMTEADVAHFANETMAAYKDYESQGDVDDSYPYKNEKYTPEKLITVMKEINDLRNCSHLYEVFANHLCRHAQSIDEYLSVLQFASKFMLDKPRAARAMNFLKAMLPPSNDPKVPRIASLPDASEGIANKTAASSTTAKNPALSKTGLNKRKQPLPTWKQYVSPIQEMVKSWNKFTPEDRKLLESLQYNEEKWNGAKYVDAMGVEYQKLTTVQQQAVDKFFGGADAWPPEAARQHVTKKQKTTEKTKKEKKETYAPRVPPPSPKTINHEGDKNPPVYKRVYKPRGAKEFSHYCTAVNGNNYEGVELEFEKDGEDKLIYKCPYCVKADLNSSGITMHITTCKHNIHVKASN